MMLQQQTQLLQQILNIPRAEAPVANAPVVNQDCPTKLPEFRRLVEEFYGDKSDPTAAKSWIEELEKAFRACQIPKDQKLSMAAFLLKRDANNWWKRVSRDLVQPTWQTFRDEFFWEYFSDAAREQMTSDWLVLRQGNKSVDEYEADLSRPLQFAGEGYHENERMKVQKF